MKKALLIVLLILASSLLESCSPDDEACFQLELSKIRNISQDNYLELLSGDTIAPDNYAILLEGSSMSETCMRNYSFGGSIMADVFYTLIDKVTNISITSNSDLSENYPKGSELKSLFVPIEIAAHCVDNPDASSDCVYDYFSYSYINTLEQGFNEEMAVGYVVRTAGLRLFALKTNEPIIKSSREFSVQFDFQSGKSVVLETEQIVLK